MYLWKCWRDTRARFFVFLALLVVVFAASTLPAALVHDGGGWTLLRGGSGARMAHVWKSAITTSLRGWGDILTTLVALALGAHGVGEEYSQGSLQFLLTRLRSRQYFVWVGWAVGLVEICVILCSALLATFVALIFITGPVYTWRFFGIIPLMLVGAAVLYAQTYLLTILTRSARAALMSSLVLCLGYATVPTLVERAWQIHAPTVFNLLTNNKWLWAQTSRYPLADLLAWLLVALALLLISQWVFDRLDV